MGLSGWHLLILGLVACLVFGGSGRISSVMGDVAKGIKSFKTGLADDEDDAIEPRALDRIEPKALDCDRSETA